MFLNIAVRHKCKCVTRSGGQLRPIPHSAEEAFKQKGTCNIVGVERNEEGTRSELEAPVTSRAWSLVVLANERPTGIQRLHTCENFKCVWIGRAVIYHQHLVGLTCLGGNRR